MVAGTLHTQRGAGSLNVAIEPIQLDPDPLAPFRISPGFKVDGILYLSGHAAISESGELMGIGDFDAQAEATFESLNRTLRAGGSDLSQVIKVTSAKCLVCGFEPLWLGFAGTPGFQESIVVVVIHGWFAFSSGMHRRFG